MEFDKDKGVEEIRSEYGVITWAFYKWCCSQYTGMSSKELKLLKDLEEENSKLKQMYATLALDLQMAKEIIEKNYKATQNTQYYERAYSLWYQQGVRVLNISNSVYYYNKSLPKDDTEIE